MSKAEQLLAALADGPLRIDALNKKMKITYAPAIVRALKEQGAVKTSEEKRNPMVALPGQKIDVVAAPPPSSKGKKKKKKKSAKSARRPRNATSATAEDFIPGLTAEGGMVAIGKGEAPIVFSPAETEKIATLLFAHFDK